MHLLNIIQSESLSIGKLVRDIPHDVPAVFVYVLVAAFVYAIWRGNRSGKGA